MKNTIFDRIEEFAYKLSDKTVNKNENMTLQERKEEKEIWDYFYFLILSQVFTFFFVILFGIVIGYLKTLIFVLIAFVFLRTKSGGYHCDSFEKCFFTTNVSFAIAGILSMSFYEYLSNWYIILVVLSNIYAIYIIPDCPLPWGNEESRGEKEDKKFQIQYKNRVIILYLINLFIIFLNKNFNFNIEFVSIGLSFGILLASFSGSIFGSKIISKFWNENL